MSVLIWPILQRSLKLPLRMQNTDHIENVTITKIHSELIAWTSGNITKRNGCIYVEKIHFVCQSCRWAQQDKANKQIYDYRPAGWINEDLEKVMDFFICAKLISKAKTQSTKWRVDIQRIVFCNHENCNNHKNSHTWQLRDEKRPWRSIHVVQVPKFSKLDQNYTWQRSTQGKILRWSVLLIILMFLSD